MINEFGKHHLKLNIQNLEFQMSFSFTQENLAKIEKEKAKYPTAESAIMSVLWIAQEQNDNWLSEDAIQASAEVLGISPAQAFGVASFYTMYNKKPVGKYHLQVCTNISCALNGGRDIHKHLKSSLNVKDGEISPDGLFTVSHVECLGSCGTAPAMQINDDYHENVSIPKVDELVNMLRAAK